MQKLRYVILDLETTGVESYDVMLEIAVIVVDMSKNPPERLSEMSTLVLPHALVGAQGRDVLAYFTRLKPPVFAMHQGLTAEFARQPHVPTTEEAEGMVLEHLALDEDEKVVLVGQSIHFDRAFIERQMPRLAKRLYHRMIDLSTVTQLSRFFFPSLDEGSPLKGKTPEHRALGDCYAAFELLCHFATKLSGAVNTVRSLDDDRLFGLFHAFCKSGSTPEEAMEKARHGLQLFKETK